MFRRRIRLTPGTVLAAVALFVALGGAAYAAGGNPFVGSGYVIHGCVAKGGAFQVVKPTKRCPRHTTGLLISQVGLPGAAGKAGAAGKTGAAGAAGHNGAVGATGPAGAAGATGATGIAIGYSATTGQSEATGATGIDLSGATGPIGKTIVAKSLPAGEFILSGKVEIDLTDTMPNGRAWVECGLIDAPTGGGAVATDLSNVSGVVNYQFGNPAKGISLSTLPFTLATTTAGHPSTAAINCVLQDASTGGGTLTVSASNASITAIQTSSNG
jgi:hypothetical protein